MKQYFLRFLTVLLFPASILAQDGYSFTLIDNGGYSFTVAAVSNYDSGSFTPKTESYGFTLVVQDGVTITVTGIQPSGSSETVTPIQGTSVSSIDPNMADKDLFLIATTTNAGDLSSHLSGIQIPLVTFTVDGAPVAGNLTLLDNNSPLASSPSLNGALDSFIQVDVTDNSTVNFINGYLGQTGTTSYNFGALGVVEIEELTLELYPNPFKNMIYVEGEISKLKSVIIYSLTGQELKRFTKGLEEIDLSRLESSIYFVKLNTERGSKTFKLVKE